MKACIGLFVFPLYRGVMCLLYSKMVSFTLNHIHFRREHYCATILFVQKKKTSVLGIYAEIQYLLKLQLKKIK